MTGFPHFSRFVQFILERHRIYERRAAGKPAPWTKDSILAAYRFCNVYRELDRVTRWIAVHWRAPYADHDDLWFAMVVARLINHPPTLEHLALPGRWNKKQFLSVMRARRQAGEKAFGSAYIVSTNGIARDKAEYLAELVLDPMWTERKVLRPRPNDSLRSYHNRLLNEQGMGTFMAAQIIADLKYASPSLVAAKDWWTFAASGPGSRRGMSYVAGFDPKFHWSESLWLSALRDLSVLIRPFIAHAQMERLHNQDLQNCLCEFSKYRRTQLGTGRPKQKFIPHLEHNDA